MLKKLKFLIDNDIDSFLLPQTASIQSNKSATKKSWLRDSEKYS